MKTKRVFWDLDLVLLQTDRLLQWILEDLGRDLGRPPTDVLAAINEVGKNGFTWRKLFAFVGLAERLWTEKEASYERHYDQESWNHASRGVLHVVELLDASCEQVLVTFGQGEFQRRKWNAMRPLHPFLRTQHFVEPGGSKGEVLASYADGLESFFVDDSVSWLDDAKLRAPRVWRIRAAWDASTLVDQKGDGRDWDVARTTFEAFSIIAHRPASL